ncbi:telomere length regulation protein TEL2 homolog [Chelonus insularis]|uniref:telomere length regulation protein TEL2 homolog n=1 Tax=Chelonus insularis TaxID=460826 RepID=UPI00158E4787|nr:telomere length regulation protein TEL2 homolog [Chelonus insularis]XP_034937034.1 telomere length regulation protein TEL2 homolog [Chelonus insularis]XP_034937035.1 telomere length regulation protein TEL2 homolog [Chelonus insularis]XP_034937036.1 telomere length regulation protein TEL2 homolog [Chelonus insularis]
METAAKQILDTLNLYDKGKNTVTLKKLESDVTTYVELFPKFIKKEKYIEQKYQEIDSHLYSQILDRILSTLDTSPINNDLLLSVISKIMVIDCVPFSIFYELMSIVDSHLKKTTNSTKIDILISTLAKVMKSDALYSSIVDICCINGNTVEKYDTAEQKWKNFLQLLVSLPSKLANKTHGINETCFQEDIYCKLMIYHLSRALLFLNQEQKQLNVKPSYKIVSSMISKYILAFGSNKFSDLIHILKSWSLNHQKNMMSVIRDIFCSIERNSVESIAVSLLKSIKNPQEVNQIFGDIINNPQWKYILTTKIPLLSYYTNNQLIINLITYLSRFQDEQNILVDLLIKLLEIWRNKSALNHIGIAQHEYIAKLIIMSVQILKKQKQLKLEDKSKVEQLIFDGTFVHLASINIEVRGMGMITSELVVSCLKADKKSPELKFDYNLLPDVGKHMIKRLQDFSEIISKESENTEVSFFEAHNDDGDQRIIELSKYCSDSFHTEDLQTINSSISNDLPLSKTRCDDVKEKEDNIEKNDDDDQNLDSDDDLIQYDSSNDKSVNEHKKPSYLRDLKENLINISGKNDPDIFSESLEIAEDLILSQLPNDDSSFALELLNILLPLKEEVYVENFKTLKLKACVAIVTVYPKECAKFLCDQFHSESKEVTINDRLLFLEILAEAARKISTSVVNHDGKKKNEVIKKPKTCSKPVSLFIDMSGRKKHEILYDDEYEVAAICDNSSENWKEIVEERIQGKTRRIAHQSKVYETTINKFNDVASYFFYPLMYGMMQNHTYIYKVPDDLGDIKNILLTSFLKTLSVLMTASKNCVIAPNMAQAILELAWSLRYHEEANIRLIIIKTIAVVIINLSDNNFTTEMLALLFEFRMWLEDVSLNSIKGDPDINCRNLGNNVMALIDSIVMPSIK